MWRSGGSGLPFRTGLRKRGVPAPGGSTPPETRRCSWRTPDSGACSLTALAARVPPSRHVPRVGSSAGTFHVEHPPGPEQPASAPAPSSASPAGFRTAGDCRIPGSPPPAPRLPSHPDPAADGPAPLPLRLQVRPLRALPRTTAGHRGGRGSTERLQAQPEHERTRAQGGQDEEQAQHPPENTTRRSAPRTQGRALTRSPRAGAGRPRLPALAPSGSSCAASAPRGRRGGALPRTAPGSSSQGLLFVRHGGKGAALRAVRARVRRTRPESAPRFGPAPHGAPRWQRSTWNTASGGASGRAARCTPPRRIHSSPPPSSMKARPNCTWGFAPSQRSSVALGSGPTGSITATSGMRRTREPTRNA